MEERAYKGTDMEKRAGFSADYSATLTRSNVYEHVQQHRCTYNIDHAHRWVSRR